MAEVVVQQDSTSYSASQLADVLQAGVTLMTMVMLFFMMTQILSMAIPEMKPLAAKQRELISRARRGVPEAVNEIESLANKGIDWAKKVWKEIAG